jgi:parallel beta-helix repeat protein
MQLPAILSDLSDWFKTFIHSDTSNSSSKPSSPPPAVNKKTDQYSNVTRAELLRSAFEGSSKPQSWTKQSPLLYSPWALLTVAGCQSGPPDYGSGGTTSGYQNHAPKITSATAVSAQVGVPLSFLVTAVDEDNDSFQIENRSPLPQGATFFDNGDVVAKELKWTPTSGQVGKYQIPFVAVDQHGAVSEESTLTITVVQDKDGDGLTSDVDCNDNDNSVFPLKNNGNVVVNSSVTICNGTYESATLTVKSKGDSKPITVKGDGVIVNSGGIFLDGAYQADLFGFQLNGAPTTDYPIHVKGNFNTLRDMVLNFDYMGGILVDNSENNKISNIKISALDNDPHFIEIEGGQKNVIENCYFNGYGFPDPVLDRRDNALGLYGSTQSNEIRNNILKGVQVYIDGSSMLNIVSGNTINNNNTGAPGIDIDGNKNTIENNLSNNNSYGIRIDGCDNTITGNNFTSNTEAAIDMTTNPGCSNYLSGNTPNQ